MIMMYKVKKLRLISVLYILLFVSGSVYGIGERTITLGGEATWRMAELRNDLAEVCSVRSHPVLVLSSATGLSTIGYSAATGVLGNFSPITEPALDMSVSFDESNPGLFRDSNGHYRVSVSPDVEAVDRRHARAGTGAALFNGNAQVIIEPQSRNALFAQGNRIRDFTIEFWMYPLNMENGEQVLSWVSAMPGNGGFSIQRIISMASRNRLHWSFVNFFTSTNGSSNITIEFTGRTPIVPRTWSHHLVRFDAATGMVEYLVNGNSEAIVYATSTGRENSEVFTPITGNNGVFSLGDSFVGLLDEFKIHNVFAGRSSVQKYLPSGGRAETMAIDLGHSNTGVVRVNASGGRIRIDNTNTRGSNVNNEFRENGRFRFSDDSEMNFFIRASENPHLLNSSPWVNFTPGTDITGIQGRYVQLAVDFYPSADGEASPYLEQLQIVFLPGEPPLPPRNLTATAVDGGVLLRWRNSPTANTEGYFVYYSSVRGELFGNDAALGSSPINAGNTNSLFVEGLQNGTLYYFRVAAYDFVTGTANHRTGEFSGEVTARPLAGLTLPEISQ
jgi:hypothetical protein